MQTNINHQLTVLIWFPRFISIYSDLSNNSYQIRIICKHLFYPKTSYLIVISSNLLNVVQNHFKLVKPLLTSLQIIALRANVSKQLKLIRTIKTIVIFSTDVNLTRATAPDQIETGKNRTKKIPHSPKPQGR